MQSVWLGEFLGTLVLCLMGGGVNAGVTLRKTYAADAGWMVIAAGWALGVLCGVLVAQAFGSPAANLNPAITLAVAIANGNFAQLFSMWSAQLLGAMSGAALMALHYGPHWKLTPDPAAKLGVFCTNAAVRSPLFNILSEAIGTAVLVLVAGAIYSRGVAKDGPANGMGQWLVASLVWASACRWAGLRGTRSIRREIWVRGLFIGCCRFRARADRTGVMPRFRLSGILQAQCWLGCCCGMRICNRSTRELYSR